MKVLFFAQLREVLGVSELAVTQPPETVDGLRALLMERGEQWKTFMKEDRTLAAVNQTMATGSTPLKEGDEVAFFPPVTGG